MTLLQLARAGRTPELPITLSLADAAGPADLQLLSLLRVLPGQRYVGAGVWRGRAVLAKLLVGPRAARQFQRERDGARCWLRKASPRPRCWPRACEKARAAGCCSSSFRVGKAWAPPGNR